MTRWCNSDSITLIADAGPAPSLRNRFLVFLVPRADMPSPLLGMKDKARNFDLAVRFYAPPGRNEDLLNEADYVMTGGLSKFHAAFHFIHSCGLQNAYDGILFLDGDLEFDPDQLSQFLSFVDAAGLDIAQPCVTRDSYCYWKMAYHQPAFVFRKTSFVEVMAPYLSRRALPACLPTFTQSISTYGLDLVWPSLVGTGAIGVVDAFQIRHRDRVDHESGNFYTYLKSIGVDLDEEERLILAHYGVMPHHAHSLRGFYWKGASPFGGQSRRLVSVPLYGPENRTEKQVLIDVLMWYARLRPGREERAEDRLADAVGRYVAGNRMASAFQAVTKASDQPAS